MMALALGAGTAVGKIDFHVLPGLGFPILGEMPRQSPGKAPGWDRRETFNR